ncbi:MAG: KEOPS complex kinase/ATPase Bud32, partial [Candidatus Micrarchaeota archaeon]
MKIIAKGAEAEIVEKDWNGRKAILKMRVKKRYRIEELDKRLRISRTKRESKVLFAAKMAGIRCPILYDADMEKTEILLEKIEGERIRELLQKNVKKAEKYLPLIGVELARLHNANIIHGDFSTANVMVGKKGEITIIDFGLSDFSASIEDKAMDLLIFKKSTNGREFALLLKGYSKASNNPKGIIRQL